MIHLMISKFKDWPSGLFLSGIALILGINVFTLRQEFWEVRGKRQKHPQIFLGWKFSGLQETLAGVPFVSYYTDRDLDDRINAMQLAQAQYVLAPTILDQHNLGHEFLLLDCDDPARAWDHITTEGLKPVKASPFGTILAKRDLAP